MGTGFLPSDLGTITPQPEVKFTVSTLIEEAGRLAMNRVIIGRVFDSYNNYEFAYQTNNDPENFRTIMCRKKVKQNWTEWLKNIEPIQTKYKIICRIYAVDDPIDDSTLAKLPTKKDLNQLTYYIEMYDPISGNQLKRAQNTYKNDLPNLLANDIATEIEEQSESIKSTLTTNAQWLALAQIINTLEHIHANK